jgi:hypothetical protein
MPQGSPPFLPGKTGQNYPAARNTWSTIGHFRQNSVLPWDKSEIPEKRFDPTHIQQYLFRVMNNLNLQLLPNALLLCRAAVEV